MERRTATPQEIFAEARNRRVLYRHFVREIYNPRSINGVSHKRYSRSKLRDIDGVPHVMYRGELCAVTATHFTLNSGTAFVAAIRLDSEYLPD